jgi:hypothetical protein
MHSLLGSSTLNLCCWPSQIVKCVLFVQAIQEQMKLHGQEPVSFQDVKDEIFDMVKPANPLRLTFKDLINR